MTFGFCIVRDTGNFCIMWERNSFGVSLGETRRKLEMGYVDQALEEFYYGR